MGASARCLPQISFLFALAVTCLGVEARLGAQPPRIVPVGPPALWQRTEFRVDEVPDAANPFDPDLIRLDATFTAPSGRNLTVPGFWYQAYTRTLVNGAEVLNPAGAPGWRIRITPTEPGEHVLSLRVALKGAAPGEPVVLRFSVPAGDAARGWVRVAPDRQNFETSDGRPLRLVGANVCWAENRGTLDYDRWFGAMHESGENFARLWMSPWWAGIEHRPGTLNRYDLASAWELDHVFQLAERDGIYLLFCLDHHGMYQVGNRNWGGSNNFWRTNPYSQASGGPCVRPNDFFTNAQAKTIYEKRLRYLVGRYGYSPYLLAWEFFNEIDNVIGPKLLNAADVVAWHREVGRWLRANDPYRHLITTSLTGGSDRPDVWAVPELDFSGYHSYADAIAIRSLPALARSFLRRYDKPVMIGEFGVDARSWNLASDPYLRGFRQGLWAGALGGSVGSAMSWWWGEMDQDGVYPLYAAMSGILRQAGWYDGSWSTLAFANAGAPPPRLGGALPGGETFDAELALNASWRSRLGNECAVAGPLAAQRSAERLSAYLQGRAHPEWQRPIRLDAWFGEKAGLTVHVNSVSSGARLVVRVDGAEVLRESIADRDGAGQVNNEINKDYAVAVSPGRHVLEVANAGADWMFVDSLRLARVRPAVFEDGWSFAPEAVGLRNGGKAVLYACSPWVVYPASARTYLPPVQARQMLTVLDWPAGRFRVQWFDPVNGASAGTAEATADGGRLVLALPEFRDDLAAIVTPAEADDVRK